MLLYNCSLLTIYKLLNLSMYINYIDGIALTWISLDMFVVTFKGIVHPKMS